LSVFKIQGVEFKTLISIVDAHIGPVNFFTELRCVFTTDLLGGKPSTFTDQLTAAKSAVTPQSGHTKDIAATTMPKQVMSSVATKRTLIELNI